jgi:threonine dehydratase
MQIGLADIQEAAGRLQGVVTRTPIVPLNAGRVDDVWIKPEVLQPIGSFKLRGAYNAISRQIERAELTSVMTLSAGNMSQAVAWSAREMGLPATAIMPESAPSFKIDATRALGADVTLMPRDEVIAAMMDGRFNDRSGFVHPFADVSVAAGNGTIGLEIIEDCPDVETVIVPVGGGGLILGIAIAIKTIKPSVRVIGVQPEAAPGLVKSLEAGEPVSVVMSETMTDGAGFPTAVAAYFPSLQRLLSGCVTVSDEQTRAAIYLLATRNKVVAEGAGALSVAAALAMSPVARGKTVCVVSGGSINPVLLADVLQEHEVG